MKSRNAHPRLRRLLAFCLIVIIVGGCSNPQSSVPSLALTPPTSAQDILNQALHAPHDTATSSDGKAELLIPKGALPSGATADQIKITSVDPSQVTVPAGINPPQLAYQLEPNGLQFTAPALLHLSLPTGNQTGIPLVSLKSGEQVSPIADASVGSDQASGQTMILAAIPHFSEVLIEDTGLSLQIDDPKDQNIGVPFEVAAVIGPASLLSSPETYSVPEEIWEESQPRNLSQEQPSIIDHPEATGKSYISKQTYTCLRFGPAQVGLEATVLIHDPTANKDIRIWVQNFSKVFLCGSIRNPDAVAVKTVPPPVTSAPAATEPPNAPPVINLSEPFHWVLGNGLPTEAEVGTATSSTYSPGSGPATTGGILDQLGVGTLGINLADQAGVTWHVSSSDTGVPPVVGEEIFQPSTPGDDKKLVDAIINSVEKTLPGSSPTTGAQLDGYYQGKYYVFEVGRSHGFVFVTAVGGMPASPGQNPNSAALQADAQNLLTFSEAKAFPMINILPTAGEADLTLGTSLMPFTTAWAPGTLTENRNIAPPSSLSAGPLANGTKVLASDNIKNSATGQEVTLYDIQLANSLDPHQALAALAQSALSGLQNPTAQRLDSPNGGTIGVLYSGPDSNSQETAECINLGGDPIMIMSTARSKDTSAAGQAQVTDMAKRVCQDQMQLFLSKNEPVLASFASPPASNSAAGNPPATAPPAGPVKLEGTVISHKANLHFGPNPGFGYVYGENAGTKLVVIGRNSDGTWVEIEGRTRAWISLTDQYGNSEFQVDGPVMSLPDDSENLVLPTSPLVSATSGNVTKGNGNTITAKWGGVGLVNSKAQAEANASLYILQYSTIENGQKIVHTQATNETSFNITPTSSGFIHITDARVYVQQAISPGVVAYAQSSLNLSALAP